MSPALLRVVLASLLSTIAALGLPPLVAAQASTVAVRPFPLHADGTDPGTGLPSLRADHAAIAELAGHDRVRLDDLAFPGGPAVDLELRRIDLGRLELGFRVDGTPAPTLLDGLALSVWSGTVVGQPGSEAVLSFSHKGSRGWVRVGGELLHLMPQPGAGGDWLAHYVLLARESDLSARGMSLGAFCGVAPPPGPISGPTPGVEKGVAAPASCVMWRCPMWIETDLQLFQLFGDLGAESTYLATLLAAVSDRYQEQVDTVLSYPYIDLYTVVDPWVTPDVFGDTWAMLLEFDDALRGDELPPEVKLAHFVSGADLGGGLAWIGVLCDQSQGYTFAVSGNIDGSTPFPVAVSPLNWDFMVFAHETGHNFGAPHTHSMDPPVDQCGLGECITDGTLMSYCHLCDGGLSNITTYFAPESAAIMVANADACLPVLAPLTAEAATQPAIVAEHAPTPLTVQVQGTPVGAVTLNYRFAPTAPFKTKPLTDQGGGTWGATLPAPTCSETPEWFYSVVDQTCGAYETEHFTAEVGAKTVLSYFPFAFPQGWTSGAPGDTATDGQWIRFEPWGDGYSPYADMSDGETDCWLTGGSLSGESAGESDVDGGTTTLLSPVLDASGTGAHIGYWRWFASDGTDRLDPDTLRVEISNDNGGNWTLVETVLPESGDIFHFWAYHEFEVADYVAPTASVRLRFIATDAGLGSTVEAAVDEVTLFRLDCETTCQPNLGLGGPTAAQLSVCGGGLSTGTHAVMALTGATSNSLATFFVSLSSNPTPFKGGTLVPLPNLLLLMVPTNGAGAASANVPGGGGPASIYVQAVFPAPGVAPANIGLTNAVRIDLLP